MPAIRPRRERSNRLFPGRCGRVYASLHALRTFFPVPTHRTVSTLPRCTLHAKSAPSVAGHHSLHEFSPEISLKHRLSQPSEGREACRPALRRFPCPAKNPLSPACDRYFFHGRSSSLVHTVPYSSWVSLGIFGRFRGFLSTGFPSRSNRSPPAFSDALPESVGRSGNWTGRGGFLAGLLQRETGMSARPAGWAGRCPLKWSTA